LASGGSVAVLVVVRSAFVAEGNWEGWLCEHKVNADYAEWSEAAKAIRAGRAIPDCFSYYMLISPEPYGTLSR